MTTLQITLATLALASAGCGSTVLTRTDRSQVEGDLIGSDAERRAVQVRFDDGTEQWIPLDTVVDADRPGDFEMLVGASWLLAGFALIATSENDAAGFFRLADVSRTMGFAMLIGGGVAVFSGLNSSQEANGHLKQAGWTD